jgi:hypothetical protein
MKSRANDVMARLSAADPALHVALDEIERRRLWQLIAASPGGGAASRRLRVRLTLAIGALLILAVVAVAASGVIRVGKPAEPASGSTRAPQQGELVMATVRLRPLIAELHYPGGEVGAGGWLMQFSSEHVR